MLVVPIDLGACADDPWSARKATGIMSWLDQPGIPDKLPLPNIPGLPPLGSGSERAHAPRVGEHKTEVLAEHGYGTDEIVRLFEREIVAAPAAA
jgi:crotonobetainyl-CoA:carnitine CoA-transferase CaiB-like acyl-CoA transferase